MRKTTECGHNFSQMSKPQADAFSKEFAQCVTALQKIDPSELDSQVGDKAIQDLIATGCRHLGDEGIPFVLEFFVSVMELGPTAQELNCQISPDHARNVLRYFVKHPELYKQLSAVLD